MTEWAVYDNGRRYVAARWRGTAGLAALAGGDTEGERILRARRLADLFTADREVARADARAARARRRRGVLS